MIERGIDKKRLFSWAGLGWLILGVGAISLVRSTMAQGSDYQVFWKTGRALIDGIPFYDLARDGGMVFKYPPWIAPFFTLFSLTSFETGKLIWGIFSVACMFGVFRILETRMNVAQKAWMPIAILFWGLWAVHAMDGQVSIPLLFLGLWQISRAPKSDFWIHVFYPAKVFTIFPVFSLKNRFFVIRTLLIAAAVVFLLSAVVCFRCFGGDWIEMMKAWAKAAGSGAEYLNAGQTRGPKNQSLTAYVCRILNVSAENTRAEVLMSFGFFGLSYLAIVQWMKGFTDVEKWIVALALTPVFHPLPWEHLYVWTFPLAAYALNDWLKEKNRREGVFYFGSLFLLTMSNSHTIPIVGRALESQVGRAWGALFMSIYFMKGRSNRV